MEGPYATAEAKSNLERISWDTASYIWYKGIPGIEEDKQRGVETLRAFWKKRVGLVPKGNAKLVQDRHFTLSLQFSIHA
jgi:hypothetical protein